MKNNKFDDQNNLMNLYMKLYFFLLSSGYMKLYFFLSTGCLIQREMQTYLAVFNTFGICAVCIIAYICKENVVAKVNSKLPKNTYFV